MKNIGIWTTLLVSLIDPSTTTRSADTWTGWLGPDRNGWVAEFSTPTNWPQSLRQVWSVKVGTGYGSPLVVDNHVFQHSRQGENEVVWRLDRTTGKVQWRKSFVVPFKTAGGGEYHGNGPKSCPVYANGRLFTMSINGTMSAWDGVSGERLWQRNYDADFEKSYPNWGASTSPIVDGNNVITHFGTDEAGSLVALDARTGREVWKHGKDGPSYSSPLLAKIGGIRQVVEWNHRSLVGVASRTGKFLWEFPFPHIGSDQNMPTPTIYNDRILLGGENRGIRSIRPELGKGGKWTVREEWHQSEVALDMSSAVINDGLLYGFSHYDSGRLFCLDPPTGKVMWTGPPRTGKNVMLLSTHGLIAALVNNGELRILNATPQAYQQVASYRVAEGHTWAPPVLLRDGVLIKDAQHLTMWSLNPKEPIQ